MSDCSDGVADMAMSQLSLCAWPTSE